MDGALGAALLLAVLVGTAVVAAVMLTGASRVVGERQAMEDDAARRDLTAWAEAHGWAVMAGGDGDEGDGWRVGGRHLGHDVTVGLGRPLVDEGWSELCRTTIVVRAAADLPPLEVTARRRSADDGFDEAFRVRPGDGAAALPPEARAALVDLLPRLPRAPWPALRTEGPTLTLTVDGYAPPPTLPSLLTTTTTLATTLVRFGTT